jgi:hypothetical protein
LPLVGAAAALPCLSFQPDDLFIYLRVVRNVLAGDGWGFNPGEPVNVASSGGWLLVLIGASLGSGRPDPLIAQVLSAFCSMLAIAGAYRLATGLTGDRLAGWSVGLALAADAWLMRWFWSGMETGLATAVAIWGIAFAADESRTGGFDRRGWCGAALLAVGPVIRPELAMLALAAFLMAVIERRRIGDRAWRRLLIAGAIVAAGWSAFSSFTWGGVVPSSVMAKGSLGAANIATLDAALRTLVAIVGTQAPLALAAVWFGRRWLDRDAPPPRRFVAGTLLWFIPLVTLAYALRHVKIYSRYALPATVLVAAVGGAALAVAAADRLDLSRARRARWLWVVAVVATVCGNLLLAGGWIVPATRNYAASMEQVVRPLALRLRASTPEGTVIAAHNIGMLGFVADRPILDLNGLATPAIVPYKRAGAEREYLASHPPGRIVEVAPQAGAFERDPGRLLLQRTETLTFHGMFPTGPDPMFMTVYSVAGVRP